MLIHLLVLDDVTGQNINIFLNAPELPLSMVSISPL